MINEFEKLRKAINKEIVQYLDKRERSELKWNKTLDEEYLADLQLYEGILEGLAIASMQINSVEKSLCENKKG
jgi:hypothetical protein